LGCCIIWVNKIVIGYHKSFYFFFSLHDALLI
jgi:hypothetical protein